MSTIVVQLLTIELVIPAAHSLKEKRRALRGLKDRLRKRFNVAVAEVAFQDKWQRALLAVTQVGSERQPLIADASHIRTLVEETPDVQISGFTQEWL